jgi:signal transduction histidine kinase
MFKKQMSNDLKSLHDVDDGFRRHLISSMGLSIGCIDLLILVPRCLLSYMPALAIVINIFFALCLISLPLLIKKNFSSRFCSNLLTFSMAGISIASGLFNGGIRAPGAALLILLPVTGFFAEGKRGARIALTYSVLGLIFLAVCELLSISHPLRTHENHSQVILLVFIVITFASYAVGAAYESSRNYADKLVNELSAKSMHSAKMSSLGEMASGISHEINNPLTIIKGKSGTIRKILSAENPDLLKAQAELLKVEQTVDRISKIIKGLKTFSRNGANDPKEPTLLANIIEDTLELCRERFHSHEIELRIGNISDVLVEARPEQISQILLNLLGNSLDAIADLPNRWISIEMNIEENLLQIIITDSGNGIEAKIAEKMMQPFFTTKEIGKGTGLGLSISMGLARDHKGKLSYDSTSANTRFFLELPIFLPRQKTTLFSPEISLS